MSHFERRQQFQQAQAAAAAEQHYQANPVPYQPSQLEQFDRQISLMQATGTDPDSQRRALVRDLTLMQIVQDREMLRRTTEAQHRRSW